MTMPVLATKLFIPSPRSKVVLRPCLIERLNEGLRQNQGFGRKLTLISAPAGFGKTSLVSEWVTGCKQYEPGMRFAWLSLDAGDNDPTCFLTYLIAALQTAAPMIGEGLLDILHSAQSQPHLELLLTTLLNEITAIPENFILVLDDYHMIEAPSLNQALTFLIDHLPSQMHMVISTREDPPLPLARWRVRGQMTELRAADLRFSPAEAAAFLNQVMFLNLSTEDIAALEYRTEGWIAGLQLAALSMQGRKDIAGFIQSFTGSHRFVLDYLVEEVLQHQSEQTRNFLLQTAILDRFCAPLCNAVNQRENGKEMLDVLEGSNLFLIPLDDQRRWYRYHHLFADMLQAHLIEAQPEHVSGLHRRASVWYEQNGLLPDAIRHSLAARDFEHAADLIERAWSAMDLSYQSATWLGWTKALPDELLRARPVLSAGYAWALLDNGELEAGEVRLQDAERCLELPMDKIIVVDKVQFSSLPASIATARAYRSLALGNIPETVKYARQALRLTPEDDRVRHNQATSLLGLAQYTGGDLEAAELSLSEFHTTLRKTGDIPTLSGVTFLLAEIRVALGRLNAAESLYQQTLRLATKPDGPMPLGTADLYRGLAGLSIERGDLPTAAHYLLTGQKLGEQTPMTDWLHRLYVSQARLREAQEDLDGALILLDEAERVYIRGPLPDVQPVAALKVRVWLKQGRQAEAQGWVHEQGLSVEDDIPYLREFEYITLARVLIAAAKNDRATDCLNQAAHLLSRLLKAAENGGRLGSVIPIQLLRALAFQAQYNLHEAHSSLKHALVLAEPEGYIRTFVDEGQALQLLIQKQATNLDQPLRSYADKLLAAFQQPEAAPNPSPLHPRPNLIEPLSERELEVLKLLRSELNGPEIAQQLIVSLNTFRTHTKSIFNKLGVNNRRAAIRRASELGLL